jgi:predicted RecB family nuclease
VVRVKPTLEKGPRLYRGAFPSVTTVLGVIQKRHFDDWTRKVGVLEARRITQEAAEFGTQVHALARSIAIGEGLLPYATAIEGFLSEHVAEVIETELELVSPRLRFGGTLDLYCRLKDGSLAVIDHKTTAQCSREHGLQLAAYAMLLRDHGYKVNRRMVVRIRKEKPGTYYCREYKEHALDVQGFLGCLNLWWWEHGPRMRAKNAS